MAKHKPHSDPGPTAAELLRPDVAEAPAPPPPPAPIARDPDWLEVRLPSAPYDEGGCRPFHIEARLNQRQQRGLQRLRNGLDLTPVRDGLGRRPNTYADVLRWLLDQVATAAGEP